MYRCPRCQAINPPVDILCGIPKCAWCLKPVKAAGGGMAILRPSKPPRSQVDPDHHIPAKSAERGS